MKRIKILTIILIIIAISMISFFGIYTQIQNRMENQVKEYDYTMDLSGSRVVRLKVSTGSKTTIKDAEGKEVEETETLTDEQIKEKGYTKEQVPYNQEEAKNLDSYKASKKVIEKRLEKLGINQYLIKMDEQTGDMVMELTENDKTDEAVSNLRTVGKFEIIDSETKEVLMNNDDIKLAKVMYGSGSRTTSQGTTVYLDIEFNKEGTKKLEEISSQYVTVEETSDEDMATEVNTTEESTEQETTTTTEKKITMQVDDEEIMSTSFEEPLRTGKLQLSIGTATTDRDTLQDYIDRASSMATLLDCGKMPIKYDVEENEYILSDVTDQELQMAEYIVLGVIAIGFIVFILRYKVAGLLGAISYIGFGAVFLLILRYTNVVLSIEGCLGIVIALVLNYVFVNKLLVEKEKIEAYKDFLLKIVPILIMVITFCFMQWVPISSFGMVMFWGIALIFAYNSIITNLLLKIIAGKEK